jgi:hypothetical protein
MRPHSWPMIGLMSKVKRAISCKSVCGIFQLSEECLTLLDALSCVRKDRWLDMKKGQEIRSGNARNVILSYSDQVYYVNRVNVCVREHEMKCNAVFHARGAIDNQPQDLELEIDKKLYDIFVEYVKLDNSDLVLILQIDGKESRLCLMSLNWLKQQSVKKGLNRYIV